jgi:hypothetical protein
MAISVTTWAGLPLGDLATWITAGVSFLAFGAVVVGLLVEGAHRKADIARLDEERHKDRISQQARLVGAFVDWVSNPRVENGLRIRTLGIHITNASDLPIRNVQGHLSIAGTFTPIVARSEIFAALVPHFTVHPHLNVLADSEYLLQLDFEDDAGIAWSKYGPEVLALGRVGDG